MYKNNKKLQAEKAEQHVNRMKSIFAKEILEATESTKVYSFENKFTRDFVKRDTKISVVDMDTVTAIGRFNGQGKIAVLNFASYVNPGGGYLKGSVAQEECLCASSFLYNVLEKFQNSFYAWNREHKNHNLYTNRALYIPGVTFECGFNRVTCDVITCAAPNKHASQKEYGTPEIQNTIRLDLRIEYILDIAAENKVDTLILGAFGCGVFRQDPYQVANFFKGYLNTDFHCFDKVIFAIPDGKNNNFKAFKEVFDET